MPVSWSAVNFTSRYTKAQLHRYRLFSGSVQQSEGSELRLNVVVDDLDSKWLERKSNLSLIHGSDGKTRFYTGLPTFAVFMALLKFTESYTHYSCAPTSQQF